MAVNIYQALYLSLKVLSKSKEVPSMVVLV